MTQSEFTRLRRGKTNRQGAKKAMKMEGREKMGGGGQIS